MTNKPVTIATFTHEYDRVLKRQLQKSWINLVLLEEGDKYLDKFSQDRLIVETNFLFHIIVLNYH